MNLGRRDLLRGAVAAGGLWLAGPIGRGGWSRAHADELPSGVEFDPAPFTLGVGSGDPLPRAVVLWTRVAPAPLAGDGGLTGPATVRWVVARDPALRDVVADGVVTADPATGGAVHVDVTGLEPATVYHYAFSWRNTTSRVGRTKTAPLAPVEHLRLAFLSCQNFEHGFFGALRNLALEDVDVVVHLGDYVYDHNSANVARQHVGGPPQTLEDYRIRHALYKGDPALREAHAAAPWICTWDDHEVAGNYANLNGRPETFGPRRAAAYQAYHEHIPIRSPEGPPDGHDFRIYRDLAFGDLVDVTVLDTRQYRDPAACPDGGLFCTEHRDHDRTMLGEDQRQWLKDRLAASRAAWRMIATAVPMMQVRVGGTPDAVDSLLPTTDSFNFNGDAWQGYQAERQEILRFIADEGIPDVVVAAGDAHGNWATDLKIDFDDPLSPIVAPEFTGTSVTSHNTDPDVHDLFRQAFYATNPYVRYLEAVDHGYVVCDVTRDRWRTELRKLVNGPRDPSSPVTTEVAFEVARGDPRLEQVKGGEGNPAPRTTPPV